MFQTTHLRDGDLCEPFMSHSVNNTRPILWTITHTSCCCTGFTEAIWLVLQLYSQASYRWSLHKRTLWPSPPFSPGTEESPAYSSSNHCPCRCCRQRSGFCWG